MSNVEQECQGLCILIHGLPVFGVILERFYSLVSQSIKGKKNKVFPKFNSLKTSMQMVFLLLTLLRAIDKFWKSCMDKCVVG